MPANPLPIVPVWTVAGRYVVTEADAAQGILISNPNKFYTVYWTTTANDVPPSSVEVTDTNALRAEQSFPLQLSAGTRIWFASKDAQAKRVNVET